MTTEPSNGPRQGGTTGSEPIEGAAGEVVRARRIAFWVGVWAPLLVVALGVLLQVLWIPRLPDPVATHWSGSGGPDGFGSIGTNILLSAIVGVGVVALFAVILMLPRGARRGFPVWSNFPRFMAAFGAGTVVFITVLLVGLVQIQLDVADARTVGSSMVPMLIALGLGAIAGLAGWAVQPSIEIPPMPGSGIAPLPLAHTERAVWIGISKPSAGYLGLIIALTLIMSALLVASLVLQSPGWWVMALVALLVLALLPATSRFRVRIDDSGLEARSAIGWPIIRVPARDIEQVSATEINPLGEFGGWGIRLIPGRLGIVLRTGPGIVVTRTGGRIFGITVDDAETGASVLAAAAERARSGATHPGSSGEDR